MSVHVTLKVTLLSVLFYVFLFQLCCYKARKILVFKKLSVLLSWVEKDVHCYSKCVFIKIETYSKIS